MRVAVIVLGDVGRSPRMQYHAYSLANLDEVKEVILIGSNNLVIKVSKIVS